MENSQIEDTRNLNGDPDNGGEDESYSECTLCEADATGFIPQIGLVCDRCYWFVSGMSAEETTA